MQAFRNIRMNEIKTIYSGQVGRLTKDDNCPGWWTSGEIGIPFFDGKKIKITFTDYEPKTDSRFAGEADQALANFFLLSPIDRVKLSGLVRKKISGLLDSGKLEKVDEKLPILKDDKEIWRLVQPTNIHVSRRPHREQDIYIQIACECGWEREHGLQLIFRQGRQLTRISGQDGHLTEADAYDKPDDEDDLLSRFNMSKRKKVFLTILLTIVIGLSYVSVEVSTTEPGLHYLVVAYAAALTAVIGLLFFFITRKTMRLKYLTILFLAVSLLTIIPTVDLGITSRIFIIGVNVLGIFAYLLSIRLTWRWGNSK